MDEGERSTGELSLDSGHRHSRLHIPLALALDIPFARDHWLAIGAAIRLARRQLMDRIPKRTSPFLPWKRRGLPLWACLRAREAKHWTRRKTKLLSELSTTSPNTRLITMNRLAKGRADQRPSLPHLR